MGVPASRTFIDLLRSLESADDARGVLLVDSRGRESFHSWPGLYRRVRALARSFRAQGIRPGARVLIPFETSVEAIASFLGLVLLGAVPMSVSAPLIGQDRSAHRRQMLTIISRFRVDRILESEELAGLEEEAPDARPLAVRPASPEELTDATPVGLESVDPEAIAFVQFSSGSTSRPKGVPVTHRALVYNLGLIVENDRRQRSSVMVSWLPLYHDMGLVGCLLSNLIHRNALVLMHPRCFMTRPATWLAAVSRHGGTVTAIPNFALDLCTERIPDEQLAEEPLDLSRFRYIYNGSEPVRPASIRRFEARFRDSGFVPGSIYPVYGMAEATLIVSAPHYGEAGEALSIEGREIPSVGHLLGDFEARILDEAGRPVAPGGTGEIHLRGTSILRDYLDGSLTSGGLIRDGWLATGDLGILDGAGRLFINGRAKDLLIVRGRNFYTHDIAAHVEQALSLRSGSAYVFSVNREEGEAVVVMVSAAKRAAARSGSAAGALQEELGVEIRRAVHQEFGLAIHDTCLVQKIPRTSSGKVMRHACERMYLESRAS